MPVQSALPDLGAVEVDHFDEWPIDDVRAFVLDAAPGLSRAERITTQYRRLVGLGLYRVLAEQGEKAGAEFVDEVARATGIAARTVGNWRRMAMDAFSLPAPTARSAAATVRESRRVPKPVTDVQSTPKLPSVEPADVLGPGPKPQAPPPTAAKPKPPAKPCPMCNGTGEAPAVPGRAADSAAPRFTRANCPHYPNARLGKLCMDCETEVGS